jgi:large subunit ribosomal protein L9
MRVILNDDVNHLGKRGDIKNVADGFARNFLIPKGFAYQETKANLARFQADKKQWDAKLVREKTSAEELAKSIEGVELTISRRVGEQEALYGSVTAADIADALAAKGVEIDKRKIELDEPIKRLGSFEVPVRLHREVAAKLKVAVTATAA